MLIVPPKRPQIARIECERIVRAHGIEGTAIVGVRGYYQESMGVPGLNDRGMYDDCIAVVSPWAFAAFNANTDPSVFKKGVASLRPGVWRYRVGVHGLSRPKPLRYPALVQAAAVTVDRDGGKSESGMFGMNVHKGGLFGTSSLGCQTVYRKQWDEFFKLVKGVMLRAKADEIQYVLAYKMLDESLHPGDKIEVRRGKEGITFHRFW